MANNNARVLLDEILREERVEVAPESDVGSFFEIFVCDEALKDRELAFEDIQRGIVDGGRDGGLDAVFVFIDGDLVRDVAEIERRKAQTVELILVQAKRETSFTEGPLTALIPTFRQLLPLATHVDDHRDRYNRAVRSAFAVFREAVKATIRSRPTLSVTLIYGCRGDAPAAGVRGAVFELEAAFHEQFPKGLIEVAFLGAPELLDLYRREPQADYALDVSELIDPKEPGIIALVRLDQFNGLISNDEGELLNWMFDSNVRDYQGKNPVNKDINSTLIGNKGEEFWWFNNGVTILVDKISPSSKTLAFSNPRIVNGLQTSYEINRYFRDFDHEDDPRHVLVRFIAVTDDSTRDRIIRATNSQTRIPVASLRATSPVHRGIEEILRSGGFFYERRKAYYKNQKRPAHLIISINYLAQAVMAMLLQRSNDSRARPGTLLNKDADYQQVFNSDYPVEMYLNATRLMKRADEFLAGAANLSRNQRTNYRFHLAMVAATTPHQGTRLSPHDLALVDVDSWTDEYLESSLALVRRRFTRLRKKFGRARDEVAKGPAIVPSLRRGMASS